MQTLSKANQARREKALNKLYRFNSHGVTNFKNLIDKGIFVKSEMELVPELKYNRSKFNAMSNWNGEQDEYYRRSTEKTKPAYFLYYDERISNEVSKFVFDYYNEHNPEQAQEASEAELNHLFKR